MDKTGRTTRRHLLVEQTIVDYRVFVNKADVDTVMENMRTLESKLEANLSSKYPGLSVAGSTSPRVSSATGSNKKDDKTMVYVLIGVGVGVVLIAAIASIALSNRKRHSMDVLGQTAPTETFSNPVCITP